MRIKNQNILIGLIFIFLSMSLNAQVADEVRNLYEEGKYKEAKTLIEAELEKDPSNGTMNYYYGMSSMQLGDVGTAEKSLTLAKSKRVNEATLYLGRLYAMQYKFDEAEKQFSAYQKAMRRNKDALALLEDEQEYSDLLKRMVSRTEDIQIIDSVVVRKDNFLSAYNLSLSSGSLEWVKDFFEDWTSGNSVAYINERKTRVYYSREASQQGETLFTMEKLLDNFGNEKTVPPPVSDNQADQAYPFVMPDGLTIYFATKGHESIGGYDIYASRLNLSSNTYLNPNQLNMPFNSPFNDYMMVIDEEKGIGWFASDRYQPEGYVCVYTFIPNSGVVLIQSDDEEELAKRAKISSLEDSWRKDKSYSSFISVAKHKEEKRIDNYQDFVFVVNDRVTYYQLSDFQSFAARELFLKYVEATEEINNILKELVLKREQYASLPSDQRILLSAEIIQLEQHLVELYDVQKKTEIRARSEEINHLNSL